ncbi:MAG: type II toxin-antitoxin system VapB family antitoxin [Proteobacteria bacterium]|nr:type II toxin-antitoxin system VapB family antitoxin [Pseudomonadota bacterium]
MDTPLVIDSEDAARLAAALSRLTGESLTASVVGALNERLARAEQARDAQDARSLARAIRINADREGRHLDRVPSYGWCSMPGGVSGGAVR